MIIRRVRRCLWLSFQNYLVPERWILMVCFYNSLELALKVLGSRISLTVVSRRIDWRLDALFSSWVHRRISCFIHVLICNWSVLADEAFLCGLWCYRNTWRQELTKIITFIGFHCFIHLWLKLLVFKTGSDSNFLKFSSLRIRLFLPFPLINLLSPQLINRCSHRSSVIINWQVFISGWILTVLFDICSLILWIF